MTDKHDPKQDFRAEMLQNLFEALAVSAIDKVEREKGVKVDDLVKDEPPGLVTMNPSLLKLIDVSGTLMTNVAEELKDALPNANDEASIAAFRMSPHALAMMGVKLAGAITVLAKARDLVTKYNAALKEQEAALTGAPK